MFDEEILIPLRGWAMDVRDSMRANITGLYVFGSLINAEGRAFSKKSSDLDLLITTDQKEPSQRLHTLIQLAPKIVSLEKALRNTMKRKNKEMITSTTLATKFELDEGIHKDRNSRIFFATATFLPLDSSVTSPSQIGNSLNIDLLDDYFPLWTVLANVQTQRNKYLRKGMNDDRQLHDFESEVYPLPKDLVRNAYAIDCVEREVDPAFGNVDDTAKGLAYICKELAIESKQGIKEAVDLLELIETNRPGGKGELKPVKAELLMYAWELLAHNAQMLIMTRRKSNAMKLNQFAEHDAKNDLVRFQATHLKCVDTAISLYSGKDLILQSETPVQVTHQYRRDVYEFKDLDRDQIKFLVSEWPDLIQHHLQERYDKEGSTQSECKVGFEGLNYSVRGIGDTPKLTIRPLTYWVTRHFNKEIAIHSDQYHRSLRREYAERLFCSAEDFRTDCPSQLFLETVLVTSDNRVPIYYKSAQQSALGIRSGMDIKTCGPEYGFVWSKHVKKSGKTTKLLVEKAIHDALFDEFKILANEVDDWGINTLIVHNIHLNSALLGVVKLKISEADLIQRFEQSKKYHSKIDRFLSGIQLYDTVQSDFGKGFWHGSALFRLTLAAEYLGTVPND